MPTCATCKWWNRDEPGDFPYDFYPCRRMMFDGYMDDEVFPDTLAYAFPMARVSAEVKTHRTFGCVMHQAKEQTG